MGNPNKKAQIIRRIVALRALSASAGATEAEASSAAQFAADLIQRYQIDDNDIRAADYGRFVLPIKGVRLSAMRSHPMVFAMEGVSHVAGVRCFLSDGGMHVVGDEVGRELAHYLFDLVRAAIDSSWRRLAAKRKATVLQLWRAATGGEALPKKWSNYYRDYFREKDLATDAKAKKGFGIGMAIRLSQRLMAMPPARAVPEDIVLQIMSDKTIRDGGRMARKPNIDLRAASFGAQAASDVPLAMGVGRGAAPLAIDKLEG